MQQKFETKICELMRDKKSRSDLLSSKHYKELVAELKEAKERKSQGLSLTAKHYRRLRRFDLLDDKLIQKQNNKSSDVIYYCVTNEMYDVLHAVHLSLGHKKEKKMELVLKRKYCNITREAIRAYLDLCEFCSAKKNARNNGVLVKQELVAKHQELHQPQEKLEYVEPEELDVKQENTAKRPLDIPPVSLASINRPLQKTKKLKTMLPSEIQHTPSNSNSNINETLSGASSGVSNKNVEDVYDQFGKYIACELRSLPLREAILVKQEIQNIITKVHLALCQPNPVNNYEYNHQPMPIDYVSPSYSHSSDSESGENAKF